ncbi:MAG: hypothetical protein ABJ314_04075 [Ilumatobacter sp.]|uniref:hypothetical protein n=1 Tax=Ilumatobacter sp. TaxID=1967498 RepID=UPI003296E3C9
MLFFERLISVLHIQGEEPPMNPGRLNLEAGGELVGVVEDVLDRAGHQISMNQRSMYLDDNGRARAPGISINNEGEPP